MYHLDASQGIESRGMLGDFKSDLYFPRYRSGQAGGWNLRAIMMMGSRGYWGEVYPMSGTVIMSGPSSEGTNAWMSLTPSELESQEIGLRAAHGHTVVFGMGMGWLAANVAMRPEVDRVTVVERDPDVLELIRYSGALDGLPEAARSKLEIVEADALEWRPDGPVDTLQADIWRRMLEPQKVDDVRRMQDNVQASAVYFWGQEMEMWRCACRRTDGRPILDWPLIRTILAEDMRLPLIVPDWDDYPQKIATAAGWWAPKEEDWWR